MKEITDNWTRRKMAHPGSRQTSMRVVRVEQTINLSRNALPFSSRHSVMNSSCSNHPHRQNTLTPASSQWPLLAIQTRVLLPNRLRQTKQWVIGDSTRYLSLILNRRYGSLNAELFFGLSWSLSLPSYLNMSTKFSSWTILMLAYCSSPPLTLTL